MWHYKVLNMTIFCTTFRDVFVRQSVEYRPTWDWQPSATWTKTLIVSRCHRRRTKYSVFSDKNFLANLSDYYPTFCLSCHALDFVINLCNSITSPLSCSSRSDDSAHACSRLARYGSRSFDTSGPSLWSLELAAVDYTRDLTLTFAGFCRSKNWTVW